MPATTTVQAIAVTNPSQNTVLRASNVPDARSRTPESIVPICPGTPSLNARTCARRSFGTVL